MKPSKNRRNFLTKTAKKQLHEDCSAMLLNVGVDKKTIAEVTKKYKVEPQLKAVE
jgi:hypothetical protein